MREIWFGKGLPLLLTLTTAVGGWLMLGPLAQSTLIVASMVKRLRIAIGGGLSRNNEAD
jgi:hypothetical protein